METTKTAAKNPNTRLFGILFGTSVLLIIPVILQFTIGTGVDGQGFNWKFNDFIIFGTLLYGTGLLCEIVMRMVKGFTNRIIVCGIVLLVFFLIWAELAVGISGTAVAGS